MVKFFEQKSVKIVIVFIFSSLLVFIVDKVCKELAQNYLTAQIEIVPGFFRLIYSENTGVAFGIKLPYLLQLVLVPGLLILGYYYVIYHMKMNRISGFLLIGIITGGALSNYSDRLIHGYVIDYISVWIWPVFNVADMAITLGIFIFILFYGIIKRV